MKDLVYLTSKCNLQAKFIETIPSRQEICESTNRFNEEVQSLFSPAVYRRAGQRRLRTETRLRPNQIDLNNKNEIAEILVKYGNNPFNKSAIWYATYLGHKNVVNLLLDNGFNIKDLENELMYVCFETKNIALGDFLLSKGASLNNGMICKCAELDYLDGLKWLFAHQVKMFQNSGDYLWYLIEKGKSTDVIELLIQNGADAKYRRPYFDIFYTGLLTPATTRGDLKLVQILINAGAPVNENLRKQPSYNPLLIALGRNFTDIAQTLVKAGAQIPKSVEQTTAYLLESALASNNSEMVYLLFDAGINVNTKTQYRGARVNALEFSVLNKNYSMAKSFLERGANVQGIMKSAIKIGDKKMIELLLEHGACIADQSDTPELVIGCTPLEAALEKYYVDEMDKAKGLNNPLQMAQWNGDIDAYRIIKNSGLFEAGPLYVKYRSKEEAINHYHIFNGMQASGCIFRAIENNDVNAVSLMLDSGAPGKRSRIEFGDPGPHEASMVHINSKRIEKFFNSLGHAKEHYGRIPVEASDILMKSNALNLSRYPLIFSDYNMELMELCLRNLSGHNVQCFGTHFFMAKWHADAGMSMDNFVRRYLKINPGDNEELIEKKTRMIELLMKYGHKI